MKKKSTLAEKLKKAKATLSKFDPKLLGTGKPLPSLEQTFIAASRGTASGIMKKKRKKK